MLSIINFSTPVFTGVQKVNREPVSYLEPTRSSWNQSQHPTSFFESLTEAVVVNVFMQLI